LTFNSNGSFSYTPTPGFSGTDSFTYTAHDAFQGSNVATVTIHVHAPPVAANDSYDVNEGATLSVAAPGVLGNDSDPGGLPLTAVLGAGPSHGTLTFNADGSFTYTPTPGFSGTDSFTYTAHDAFQGSNVATVTIHVHAPPVAVVDSYNVTEGATLTVAAPGVLGNDSDPGGLPLTAVLGAGPSHGTLTFNADGSFTYRPTPGFSGTDSFTYTAHDAFQGSNVATVTIHVNAPPVVTSTVPAGGATERPLSQAVTVNFNESVDATAGAFKLECPAGTAKAFTSSPTLPASGSVFVLVPSGPLPAGTTCTVTVVASHVSATGSGVPMAADFVFSFTTGATPVVTSTTPASGATNVPLGQAVTVTFNEPVKASAGSFALECPSGTPVAFTVPTTSPSSAYQIVPSAALPQGTVCTVTVKASGVTSVDPGDVPLAANDVFSFTTGVAPIVSATAPSNGAANQALSPAISVTFNEPVNVTSASAFSLACPSATAEPITVTPTPLNGNTTFTLTPSSPLPQGTTCTVTVNHADVSGAAAGIPMAADFTASFTTGSQPTVSSTTPVNGATGVSPSGAVTISFFENVAVSSSSAFDIECPTGTPEPFTLSPAAPGNASLFTLTPTGPLPANTVCTVTVVASDVASTPPSSMPMAANYVFSFTTASQPQAVADSYSSIGNVGITVPAAGGVLANDTLNGNSISAFDATSAHGGTVSMTTSGAGAGGFTYDPPVGFSGSDSFNYTLGTGGNTSSAKVTITDSAPVWFIDSSTTAPGDDGRLSSPFKSIADFDAVNDGGAGQPAAGQAIFVYKGSGYTSGLTLLANQVVVGQGASASLVSIAGLTVPTFSNALPSTAPASAPSITTSAGAGITLNSGNTIRGVHVGATAGPGVSGSSPGALTLGSAGPSSDVTVANTTAGADGVDLSGSGNWTVGASISATGGFSLKVSGASGTDGFSGPVSGSGQGVSLTGDAGAVNFTGGVSLSTGANPAFTATGGGTVSVACPTAGDTTCAGNTLTSTTATALNVSGTTIGGAGVTFRSISAGPFTAPPVAGGAQGIVLSGTGAGPFAVTGSGSAGSGGTISKVESTSVSAAEVSLTNTGPVSLNEMTITGDPSTANDDESGIFATNTNGLTVTNSSVTNSVGPQIFLQYTAGSTLTGSFDIAGNNVGYQGSRSSGSGIQLEFHGSGTVTGHVHGNIEGDAANANTSEFASDGGEGIDVTSDGGGTVTADISNNTVDRVLSSYGIDLQAGGNTAGGTLNATVASNTIHMDQATSADGITIVSGTNTANHATVCLNMNGNTSAAAGTAASNEQFPFDGAGVSLVQNGQTGDSTFAIQGYTGGATDLAAVQTFEINANTLSGVSDPDDEAVALIQNSAANGFTNATCPTAP
jgi:methionine-rich copper-binding protein CopC